jgi:hypothetical protein
MRLGAKHRRVALSFVRSARDRWPVVAVVFFGGSWLAAASADAGGRGPEEPVSAPDASSRQGGDPNAAAPEAGTVATTDGGSGPSTDAAPAFDEAGRSTPDAKAPTPDAAVGGLDARADRAPEPEPAREPKTKAP